MLRHMWSGKPVVDTHTDAEIDKLREKGEIYEPTQGHLRVS